MVPPLTSVQQWGFCLTPLSAPRWGRCARRGGRGIPATCRIRLQGIIIAGRSAFMKIRPEDALEYHSSSPAGKLSVIPTKPCRTQRDLSLAYTPGVAVPCLEIERDPSLAYKYTAK